MFSLLQTTQTEAVSAVNEKIVKDTAKDLTFLCLKDRNPWIININLEGKNAFIVATEPMKAK